MVATASPVKETTGVHITHIIKGETRLGTETEYSSGGTRFFTPKLDLRELVWARTEPGPAFDLKLAEVLDLLTATGDALRRDEKGFMAEAAEQARLNSPLDPGVIQRSYQRLPDHFGRERIMSLIEGELGDARLLDEWVPFKNRLGGVGAIRAFPPRLVHVMAGNAPNVAASTIIRSAILKGVHLLKLPSNDLFTAPAILRTMAAIAPGHPTVRSFSAVYWRGGDAAVEGTIFRPQYFDKLVAWGGESAIKSAKNYIGPGFELVAFDPKTSISIIGKEALASPERITETAELAASDSTVFNQAACSSSRFHYVEAENDEILDQYCAELQKRMGVERRTASVYAQKVPSELQEEIETLKSFDDMYRVWGDYDGKGLVIRSEEPLDMYPDGKIVNVVRVPTVSAAVRYATVATQTVGVYPPGKKAEIRNALASVGVQRVITLGGAASMVPGMSHDGFFPLHRMTRWVNDEGLSD
jgi:hypothetical protein